MFDVDVRSDIRIESVRDLRSAEHVVSADRIDDRRVRITTDLDAAAVGDLCAARLGTDEVTSLAPVPPDWDEVFIALVGDGDGQADSGADASRQNVGTETVAR